MMLLLDTHVWLWMIGEHERLNEPTRAALRDPDTDMYLSAAAVWELAIKHAAGKLKYTVRQRFRFPSR